MISKPGKDPHEVSSYRPISLLPILSKVLDKIIIKRLRPVIETEEIIPLHQFGFREKYSTIDQVYRITIKRFAQLYSWMYRRHLIKYVMKALN